MCRTQQLLISAMSFSTLAGLPRDLTHVGIPAMTRCYLCPKHYSSTTLWASIFWKGKLSHFFCLFSSADTLKQTILVAFHDQARTCISQPFQTSQPKLFLWLNNGPWNQPSVAISGWSVPGVQRVGFVPAAQYEWAVRTHPIHRRRAPVAMACRPLWRSASKRLSSVFRSRERIFHSCVEWFIKSIERCITLDTCTFGYDPAFVICVFSCLLRASGGIAVKSQQHNSGVF